MDTDADLNKQDRLHLDAADGWLGLGNLNEAVKELDQISPGAQNRQDVLQVRWRLLAKARRWKDCWALARTLFQGLPEELQSQLKLGLTLFTRDRVTDAIAVLEEAAERFGEHPLLALALATCFARLRDANRAREILERANVERVYGLEAEPDRTWQRSVIFLEALWMQLVREEPAE